MLRTIGAHARAVGLVAVCALGCGPSPALEPTETEPGDPAAKRPRRNPPTPTSKLQPPSGRRDDVISPEDLEAALAAAAEALAGGNKAAAIGALRACGNMTPISARCDGLLGTLLAENPRHRAEAAYYLHQASNFDDPTADSALYLGVCAGARSLGGFGDAVEACRLAVARTRDAKTLLELSRSLQSIDGGQIEAAELLAEVYALDATQIDLLFERAVLLGQVSGAFGEAAEGMRKYLEVATHLPADRRAAIENRIAQLEVWAAIEAEGGVLEIEGYELQPTPDGKHKTFKRVGPGGVPGAKLIPGKVPGEGTGDAPANGGTPAPTTGTPATSGNAGAGAQ